MTRAEFIAELRREIEAFDHEFEAHYPLLGDPSVPDHYKPVNARGELGFRDWFEQFLAFHDPE